MGERNSSNFSLADKSENKVEINLSVILNCKRQQYVACPTYETSVAGEEVHHVAYNYRPRPIKGRPINHNPIHRIKTSIGIEHPKHITCFRIGVFITGSTACVVLRFTILSVGTKT